MLVMTSGLAPAKGSAVTEFSLIWQLVRSRATGMIVQRLEVPEPVFEFGELAVFDVFHWALASGQKP
jgi:hypothetical protein